MTARPSSGRGPGDVDVVGPRIGAQLIDFIVMFVLLVVVIVAGATAFGGGGGGKGI